MLVCPYILGELETQVQNLYVYIFRKFFNSHLFLVKFTPGLPQSGPGYAWFTTVKKLVSVSWCGYSWLAGAPALLSLEGPSQSERMVGWSTKWEPGKTEKYPPLNLPPPKLKRKKCKAHSMCAWAFPLVAWNFSSQKSSSPFLAWPLPLTSPVFFIEFDWPQQKKIETMKAHKNWRFYGQMGCLPLWPTDICEKGGLWAKHMGLKQGAIGNTHGEHIGNLLEQRKNEKNLFFWSFCLQNEFTD